MCILDDLRMISGYSCQVSKSQISQSSPILTCARPHVFFANQTHSNKSQTSEKAYKYFLLPFIITTSHQTKKCTSSHRCIQAHFQLSNESMVYLPTGYHKSKPFVCLANPTMPSWRQDTSGVKRFRSKRRAMRSAKVAFCAWPQASNPPTFHRFSAISGGLVSRLCLIYGRFYLYMLMFNDFCMVNV